MDQAQEQQSRFSNCLNLLSAANYQDPASRWSNAKDRDPAFNSLLRVLNTIALCMATGDKGDVIGSAFFETRQEKIILLSKNADPSSKDIRDAIALISRMQNSGGRDMLDILPFIARRGAKGVQNRLTKLSELIEECRNELLKYLQIYTVDAPGGFGLFRSEFPEVGEEFFLLYRKTSAEETNSAVKRILEDIIDKCEAQRNFVNEKSSLEEFKFVVSAATALGKSRFFQYYIEARRIVKTGDTVSSKLWRNLDKVRQYIRIEDTIRYVQLEGPFTVKWIFKADLQSAADFEFKSLSLKSVWDTIKDLNTKSNAKQILDRKNAIKHFQGMNRFWNKKCMEPRHATTTLHAELKLIVYLEIQAQLVLSSTPNVEVQHPIGCSKRSCLVCTWTMDEINKLTQVTYLTAGSHTGVYATCAQIGPIPRVDLEGKCGERVFQRLVKASTGMVDKLYEPFDSVGVKGHKNKHSEDYASASDPDGEGEPDKSTRTYGFVQCVKKQQFSR